MAFRHELKQHLDMGALLAKLSGACEGLSLLGILEDKDFLRRLIVGFVILTKLICFTGPNGWEIGELISCQTLTKCMSEAHQGHTWLRTQRKTANHWRCSSISLFDPTSKPDTVYVDNYTQTHSRSQ